MNRLFVIACVTLASSASYAAEVAVFPISLTNLSSTQAEVMGTVIAQQYAKATGRDVLGPQQIRDGLKPEGAAATAQALGVTEYLEVSAIALDKDILIDVARRSRTGELLARAEMTAVTLDDLAPVGERLALALQRKLPSSETVTVGNVTEKETRGKNRVSSEKVLGIKTSFGFPVASAQLQPFATLGFDGRLEGRSYFIEVGAGAFVPASDTTDRHGYGGLYMELGGSYYLLDNASVAPYVGGGVSPRLLLSSDSRLNIAPYLQAGVMFFREARTRLYVDVRASQNLLPVEWHEYTYDGAYNSTDNVRRMYPFEAMLQIGVGF